MKTGKFSVPSDILSPCIPSNEGSLNHFSLGTVLILVSHRWRCKVLAFQLVAMATSPFTICSCSCVQHLKMKVRIGVR